MRKLPIPVLAISMTFTTPALAQGEELSPEAAAGKSIYEGVTHRLGCEQCHGPDGTAQAEGKEFAAERSIQGKTAQEIRIAIIALPMISNVKLTDEQAEQVAAYLDYLQASSN